MRLRLLAVLAHPDDESLGFGGTLARYAEGVGTYLVTATENEDASAHSENQGTRWKSVVFVKRNCVKPRPCSGKFDPIG